MFSSSALFAYCPCLGDTGSFRRAGRRLHVSARTESGTSPGNGAEAVELARATMLPQFTRRFTIGLASSLGLAVGANFGGLTSLLLGLNPEAARSLRLDVLYPIGGFFRCLDMERGYEFIYPQGWVGDQKILYRAVEKAEKARSLDLPALQGSKSMRNPGIEPVAAFGPPGTSGELNVSVILAPILPSFMIDKLGDAREAGSVILSKFIAPPGSNKTANLIDAYDSSKDSVKTVYYTLEYTVKGPDFYRHNVAVYTTYKGQLYSLNVQSPEEEWLSNKDSCIAIANSFSVLM